MPFFIVYLQFFDKKKKSEPIHNRDEVRIFGFSGNEVRVFFFAAEWTCMQNSFEYILQADGMPDDRTFRSKAAH